MRKHEESYIIKEEIAKYGGEFDMTGFCLGYNPEKGEWTTWKFAVKEGQRTYGFPFTFRTAERAKMDYHNRLAGYYKHQLQAGPP